MTERKSKVIQPPDQRSVTGMKICALIAFLLVSLSVLFFVFESEITARILPHLPHDERKTVHFYTDLLRLLSFELLWYAGFIVVFIFIVAYFSFAHLNDSIKRLTSRPTAVMIIVSGFVMILVIGHYILDRFPNSGDEYVYLYQAKTMADGKLWEKTHDLPQFFYFNHTPQRDGITVGRFPPGWPAFLALAFYFDFPAFFVDPILALIVMFMFYAFAKRHYSKTVAVFGLLAFVFTSYFLYFSASYFSHISCMLVVLGFVACLYRYMDTRAVHYALAAGFFLGVAATIRYFTAFLIFLPFVPMLLAKYRVKSISIFVWIGLGALPCLIFLLWFNYSITGNPLLPVTVWAYPQEALGFVKGHTPMQGVEHFVRRVAMFLYWCSPGLLILYAIYLIQKLMKKSERLSHVEDYTFAILAIGYFFYYEIGGDQYGPRFLLEAFPFLVLFVTRKVLESRSQVTTALFIAGIIYAVAKIPFISKREHMVIKERTDVYAQAEARRLKDAVVLIPPYVGDIRPMPVGDLTRNNPPIQKDVLFVFDIPGENEKLFNYYPQHDFYRYQWLQGEGRGRLVKLEPHSDH